MSLVGFIADSREQPVIGDGSRTLSLTGTSRDLCCLYLASLATAFSACHFTKGAAVTVKAEDVLRGLMRPCVKTWKPVSFPILAEKSSRPLQMKKTLTAASSLNSKRCIRTFLLASSRDLWKSERTTFYHMLAKKLLSLYSSFFPRASEVTRRMLS